MSERVLAVRNSGPVIVEDKELDVTMSIGQAVFPYSEKDPYWLSWDECTKLVDNLLYIAKEKGRNQAVNLVVEDKATSDEKKNVILGLDKSIEEKYLKTHKIRLDFTYPLNK